MAKRPWFDIERHQAAIEKKFARTDQAPVNGQYWIARRISLPARQFHHLFGVNFRHLTVEGAAEEAQRRAANHPGETWGVFEFTGMTFRGDDTSNMTDQAQDADERGSCACA